MSVTDFFAESAPQKTLPYRLVFVIDYPYKVLYLPAASFEEAVTSNLLLSHFEQAFSGNDVETFIEFFDGDNWVNVTDEDALRSLDPTALLDSANDYRHRIEQNYYRSHGRTIYVEDPHV